MQFNFFFFGSDDSGARKYFYSLFSNTTFHAREFRSLLELKACLQSLNKNCRPIVLTGSSLGQETLDKLALIEARSRDIKCYSIVEHWSWYAERFSRGNDYLYPDKILVNDSLAMRQAIDQGLPKDLLIALGNPLLEEHALAVGVGFDRYDTQRIALREKYQLPIDKKVIVFVSEELHNDFQSNQNNLLGFDEYQVLADLVDIFSDKEQLVVKKHPAESQRKYEKISKTILYLENIPVVDLAKVSDVLIGMGSMLLIELALFRDDILSYMPNSKKAFVGDLLNIVVPIKHKSQILCNLHKRSEGNKIFRERFIGSKLNILSFLKMIDQ